MRQGSGPSVTIPKTKLGLPGASYQLHVHGGKRGQTAPTLTVVLQDNYRIV
jgi:hypothetical protein